MLTNTSASPALVPVCVCVRACVRVYSPLSCRVRACVFVIRVSVFRVFVFSIPLERARVRLRASVRVRETPSATGAGQHHCVLNPN